MTAEMEGEATRQVVARRRGVAVVSPVRRLDPQRIVDHLPRLYRAARAWTGSREDAEDLVQEVCARVLARTRFVRGDDEIGYLLRTMHNVLVSRRRSASRRPVTAPLDDDELLELLPLRAPAGGDPEAALEASEVYEAIADLPEEFRDAIVAVDVVGFPYAQAARLLGVPEGTLTSRLFRARDRLARRLGEEAA